MAGVLPLASSPVNYIYIYNNLMKEEAGWRMRTETHVEGAGRPGRLRHYVCVESDHTHGSRDITHDGRKITHMIAERSHTWW